MFSENIVNLTFCTIIKKNYQNANIQVIQILCREIKPSLGLDLIDPQSSISHFAENEHLIIPGAASAFDTTAAPIWQSLISGLYRIKCCTNV